MDGWWRSNKSSVDFPYFLKKSSQDESFELTTVQLVSVLDRGPSIADPRLWTVSIKA